MRNGQTRREGRDHHRGRQLPRAHDGEPVRTEGTRLVLASDESSVVASQAIVGDSGMVMTS